MGVGGTVFWGNHTVKVISKHLAHEFITNFTTQPLAIVVSQRRKHMVSWKSRNLLAVCVLTEQVKIVHVVKICVCVCDIPLQIAIQRDSHGSLKTIMCGLSRIIK